MNRPKPALSFARAETLLAFLRARGADRMRHSERTFLDHLVGTATILQRWNAADSVCRAGLFHSIYGTQIFRDRIAMDEERPRIRSLLGTKAEKLAHTFCILDRSSIGAAIDRGPPYEVQSARGDTVRLPSSEFRDLLWILWANALEQAPYTGSPQMRARSRQLIARSAPYLPRIALRELQLVFGTAGGPEPNERPQRPGLRALLGVDDTARFFSEYWPEIPLLVEGPVERLAGLVDHDFEALTRMKRRYARAFFRKLDGTPTSTKIQPGQERALYDAGFTIYFHDLVSPQIDAWVRAIDEDLGLVPGVTRVAAFASRLGPGLLPHFDQNDNFVCQARGAKRFRIAANTHVRYPTKGYKMGAKLLPVHEVQAPNGFPTEMPAEFTTVDLRPGSVLFMPRGFWHDAETTEGESLHFNIQSGLAMWKDAIEYVLTETSALYGEELRAPILRVFEGEALSDGFEAELKKKLRAVLEDVCESEILLDRGGFNRFVAARRRRP